MTQEQYNRAMEINQRLEELEKIKDLLQNSFLTFIRNGCCASYPNGTFECIGEYLSCHDKMIREEIDNEIEKLKKEIEEL